jgi:hypothetical protein
MRGGKRMDDKEDNTTDSNEAFSGFGVLFKRMTGVDEDFLGVSIKANVAVESKVA